MSRKISLERNEYSKMFNREYNVEMKLLSDEIFQTEDTRPVYMPISDYDESNLKYSAYQKTPDNITTPVESEKIDSTWNVLSNYEKIIASHLLYGFYPTYIFSGGMGSGKTSTATHVLNFIKSKFSGPTSAFIKISFDFNERVVDNDQPHLAVKVFADQLYSQLKVKIHTHIKNNDRDLVRLFIDETENNNFEECHEYFDFASTVNSLSWRQKDNKERAYAFFEFVENKEADSVYRIELTMKFLRFLKKDLKENEFIVLFYDNIDILEPHLQRTFFRDYILRFNYISKAKCLICLRRTTFSRSFDYRDLESTHSYGFIHHHGHLASSIIKSRLQYYINNIDNHNLFKVVEPRYMQALRDRLAFLHNELDSVKHQHSLSNFIDALAGNSVRLGLFIANRLVINNIIKFTEPGGQRDRFKKALIVSSENNLLLSNYQEVVNLFTVDGYFSLLPLQILKMVQSGHQAMRPITVGDLKNDEILLYFHDEIVIIQTLKMLMASRRPLIWVDKAGVSKDLDEQSILYVTEIGDGYLNHLVSDLTYIQECLMVAEWDSDEIPSAVDMQNEFERFRSVLMCLRIALDYEFELSENFPDKYESHQFIVLKVIEDVIHSIANLMKNLSQSQLKEAMVSLLTYILYTKNVKSSALSALLTRID